MKHILASDVGGTKVIMALLRVEGAAMVSLAEKTYPSADYAHYSEIVSEFRAQYDTPVDATGIGVAGPVFDRRCQATNLPWVLDARELERTLPVGRVALVNDFKAAAMGVLHLGPADWVDLNPAANAPEPTGPIAILGAGTGLGEAFLFHAAGRYHVVSSEGGHTDFAPRNEDEIGLLRFLVKRHGRVSYERVVSGMGIQAIYEYLLETDGGAENADVRRAIETEKDDPAVISRFAQQGGCSRCAKAMDLFMGVYGAEAGNLALKVIATGGVYVTGGIAPKNLKKIQDGTFVKAFTTKGRFSPLVSTMPLRVVTNKNVGLLGAAAAALELESLNP